jgi:hypothetical protein
MQVIAHHVEPVNLLLEADYVEVRQILEGRRDSN